MFNALGHQGKGKRGWGGGATAKPCDGKVCAVDDGGTKHCCFLFLWVMKKVVEKEATVPLLGDGE